METITIKGQARKSAGTKAARALRGTGAMPAIVYGHGQPPEPISLARHEVEVALGHGARTLEIDLRGEKRPYLIKEVQYDHLGITPLHMDLARVDLTEKVRVRVGIALKGIPKGVSEGGVLDQHMADLEVDCLVSAIPGTLHPLVSHLHVGESLLVKDLQLPPGVEAVADPGERVASVKLLVIHEPVAGAPVPGEVPAEPELITRVKKEEDEEQAE
ncbi:MAG: 50S ribosomal protein L25 [Planctomycetota bacterium]